MTKIRVGQRAGWLLFALVVLGAVVLAGDWTGLGSPHALAASGCSVDSLNPHNPPVDADTGFDFQISDADSDIQWIGVTSPSANVSVYDASASDFSAQLTANGATFSQGDVPAGNPTFLHLVATVGDYFPPANWTVQASTSPNGANPITCGGDTSLAVSDTNAPTISSISATVTSTSAIITWQTNKLANSEVLYGTDTNYGQQQSDSANVQTHRITLSHLQPNTAYHYQVVSVDEPGNSTSSDDNTFLTPVQLTQQNPTTTSSTTSTPPLQVVVTNPADKTPPAIAFANPPTSKIFKSAPTFTGTASDDVSVQRVEYSTDGGKDWLPVDSAPGLNTKQTTFSFTPANLDDGNYQVMARAIDAGANVTATSGIDIVIDRLPPIVGGNALSLGTELLQPDQNGNLTIPAGVNEKLTMNAVGGPTEITVTAILKGAKTAKSLRFNLTRSASNGLWQGVISFEQPGNYQLLVHALDGAGNQTSRVLNDVTVEPGGSVTDGHTHKPASASVTVYYRDPDTNNWVEWDGGAYGQANPMPLTRHGSYSYFLPAGTYYLKATGRNYQAVDSKSFTLNKLTIVAPSFVLHHSHGLRLGPLYLDFNWPSLSSAATTSKQTTSNNSWKPLILEKPVPNFSLPLTNGQSLTGTQLLGKPTILTFISTWAPPAQDQLEILNQLDRTQLNVVPVSEGESAARLSVYNNIAGYNLPILADSDQQLIGSFGVTTLPTIYFIDRHGVVKRVMVGVLSKEDLLKNVQY
jgi:peroxiredoxin